LTDAGPEIQQSGVLLRVFNWSDLVFFLELARQSRLMPAARRLKVDHTTVSRRIGELEKDLGTKLFHRNPDGFFLTEEGHRLYAVAERMEAEAIGIGERLQSAPAEPCGRVRVATMEGIAAYYLGGRFAELRESHPAIVIELITERHLINLTRREADISISFVPMAGPRLVMKKAGHFRLALSRPRPTSPSAARRRAGPASRPTISSTMSRISCRFRRFTGSSM
jgi:DNA-binding transcriptional LysR family regulator